MVRSADRPDMTSAAYRERKALNQTDKHNQWGCLRLNIPFDSQISVVVVNRICTVFRY